MNVFVSTYILYCNAGQVDSYHGYISGDVVALTNKTLDISSSFQSLLAESRGHQRLREAIAKLRFAPASRNLFPEIKINSFVNNNNNNNNNFYLPSAVFIA